MKDLYGEKLMMIRQGWNSYVDEMREDLLEKHPQIYIEDFEYLNLEAFNHCESNQRDYHDGEVVARSTSAVEDDTGQLGISDSVRS